MRWDEGLKTRSGSDPYLGRESVYHLDRMILVSLNWSFEFTGRGWASGPCLIAAVTAPGGRWTEDLSRWSCGGAVHGRAWTTSRAGFLVGCGHEAESLDIAEPAGKRVLDQARRQRRRPAPATDPQKREHLRLRPRGQQDKQRAADLDQVQPAQERSAAPLPHRAHAVRQLERGE